MKKLRGEPGLVVPLKLETLEKPEPEKIPVNLEKPLFSRPFQRFLLRDRKPLRQREMNHPRRICITDPRNHADTR